jgi:CHAT domain-containing protein
MAYHAQRDFKKAGGLYRRSLDIAEKAFGTNSPIATAVLGNLAVLAVDAGETQQGVSLFDEWFRRWRSRQANELSGLPEKYAFLSAADSLDEISRLHSVGARERESIPVCANQLALGKAFLEEVQATQAALDADPRTATRELREQHQEMQLQLVRLSESKLPQTEREAKRVELQTEFDRTESELATRVGLVAQAIRERSLTLTDIARNLPTQSVLVDFIQYQRCDFAARTNQWREQRYAVYLTFPLARDSTNVVVERVDLGEAAPINEAVGLVCKRMSAGQFAAKDLPTALQKLSQLVYVPLASHLTNVSHLIICPDGQLSRLPFEMLPVGNKFLIEEKTISYVTSGREIVRIASPKSSIHSSKSLVMGNPDFNLDLTARSSRGNEALKSNSQLSTIDPQPGSQSLLTSAATRSLSRDYRGLKFNPLPGSGVEATNVAGLLGTDATLRLGADAREAELKAVVSPRVLHLATHGFFLSDQEFKHTNSGRADLLVGLDARQRVPTTKNDWENPLVRCGIALAGANHALQITNAIAEDGLLTGLEASLLNLQGTELVILSACDSGAGEVKIGEGVMSLQRAFRIAGAESVLASHWPVSDKATSRLMTEFMRRWRAGEPRAQAWREAQLELLRSKDFPNPYFWAAFTLTGQWN